MVFSALFYHVLGGLSTGNTAQFMAVALSGIACRRKRICIIKKPLLQRPFKGCRSKGLLYRNAQVRFLEAASFL